MLLLLLLLLLLRMLLRRLLLLRLLKRLRLLRLHAGMLHAHLRMMLPRRRYMQRVGRPVGEIVLDHERTRESGRRRWAR